MASFRRNKYFWEIRKYNGLNTCNGAKISQDHTKFDLDTIAQCIEPLAGSNPSFKVKAMIAEFNLGLDTRFHIENHG